MKLILLCVALIAGMMAPLQAGLNGKMGRVIGDPVYAALISFLVGTIGLLCYAIVTRVEFASIRHARNIHWTVWSAGLLGAFYVTAIIIIAPKLGATLTFGLIIAGQLAMSVFLDHFGLLGIPVQSFSWLRLLGITLITAGVLLIRKY